MSIADIYRNLKDEQVKVVGKLIALAGMLESNPIGAYIFEKVSSKIIQYMLSGEDVLNVQAISRIMRGNIRDNPEARNIYGNYAEMFGCKLSNEEIKNLDIADVLSQGLPVLKKA